MEQMREAAAQEKRTRLPLIFLGVTLAIALGGYLALCALAANSGVIFPEYRLSGIALGGMSQGQAADALEQQLPQREVDFLLPALGEDGFKRDGKGGFVYGESPAMTASYERLGVTAGLDYAALAKQAYDDCHGGSFLSGGWTYLQSLLGRKQGVAKLTTGGEAFSTAVEGLAEELSSPAQDTAYTLGESSISVTKAKSGLYVGSTELKSALEALIAGDEGTERLSLPVEGTEREALSKTAQDIYDEVAGEMKNAGYDPVTKAIYPEQVGADFDVARATQLLDAALPGETVELAAKLHHPTVTQAQLEGVLFRDKLGSATTHVGGSSGRIGNVRLSASSIHNYILNSGEIFSYNEVVGQRTAANGYKPAPAYVQGETVDEIGGGICQTSSTLYLAALRSNLKIVERYAHRYVPAYIPWGMDATVSWGGPEFRFQNDTEYPIRVETVLSSKNQLTISFYGTKLDDSYVKMTNETLSTIPSEVEYQDDPTLPAGKEVVKQTPYTGYKVRTYRNVYSGDGKLLSSTLEASSHYKPRNKIILRGPAVPVLKPEELPEEIPVDPELPPVVPETPVEPVPPVEEENPAGTETPPVLDIAPNP